MSITALRSRGSARLAVLYVVAALVAAGAALLLSQASGGAPLRVAHAANHCTRFAPNISQDFNCFATGSLVASGFYSTPSTALRDITEISLASSRSWNLASSGGNYAGAGGTGTAGNLQSSGGYAYAECWIAGSGVQGNCETQWHD
jgi:hypothetical protein